MAGQQPDRKFFPVTFGGVLDESQTPARIGGSGLTACRNLIYRRFGAWGKRAGSTLVYVAVAPQNPPPTPPAPPPPYSPPPTNPPNPPPPPPGYNPPNPRTRPVF